MCVHLTAGGAAGSCLPDHWAVCPSSLGKKRCSWTHPERSTPGVRHEDEPQRAKQQGTFFKYKELLRKLSRAIEGKHTFAQFVILISLISLVNRITCTVSTVIFWLNVWYYIVFILATNYWSWLLLGLCRLYFKTVKDLI